MKFDSYKFSEITINFDSKRIPLSSKQRSDKQGAYPYYGAQGIIDYVDDFIFDGKFLLIAEDGENLKSRKQKIAQLANGKFWVNNHAHIIQTNEKCILEYLYYMFNTLDISGYITGSAQPKLSQSNLNAIVINLPSIEVQKKIVSILSAFDEKIALNQQINNNLEQQVQAIYQNWYENNLGKDLPSTWKTVKLGDFVTIQKKTFNPSKEKEVLLEHYSIPAFDEAKFPVFESSTKIKSNKYVIDQDCFMISKLNPTTKRVWKPYCISKNAVCSTEFIVYKAKHIEMTDFLFSVIDSASFSDFMCSHVTGSTGSRQRTTPSDTLNFEFVLPSYDEVSKFTEIVRPIYEQIKNNYIENDRLRNIRDNLLPRLMTGEFSV